MAKRPGARSIGLQSELEPPLRSRAKKPRDQNQPKLPFDPMPDRIEPCLALLVSKPPKGPDWTFEVKWDGYRLAVHIEPNGVRVLTRGGHDWTHRFPAIAKAAAKLGTTAILDGEAVVLDERGRSSFGLLQQSLGGRGGKRISGESIFYAFDLLYFDGHDFTTMEQGERRTMLEDLLTDPSGVIRLSEEIGDDEDGEELLERACEMGLEGIIAKDKTKPYRSGRLGDWQKIKCIQSDSFVVVGYEPSTKVRGAISRLLMAAKKGGGLVYVGGVGTGYTHKQARDLLKQLSGMKASKPAVALKRKNAVFVDPILVAEIEYRSWTQDDKLRHASFKGLREDADHAGVFEMLG